MIQQLGLLHFQCEGTGNCMIGELRSCKPWRAAKKKSCLGLCLPFWIVFNCIPGPCFVYPFTDHLKGFPGGSSGKETAWKCRRHKRLRFDPWVGKITCWRQWQLTLVFLAGESHGQRSLVGYSPQGSKESDMTEMTAHVHAWTFESFLHWV